MAEVSQTCFVFDVVKFKKLRKSRRIVSFLTSSSSKLRKSRRIVSFLMLSSSKIEEGSQNCCVFKLTDGQADRQADKQIDR